jgi:hypothetical protein
MEKLAQPGECGVHAQPLSLNLPSRKKWWWEADTLPLFLLYPYMYSADFGNFLRRNSDIKTLLFFSDQSKVPHCHWLMNNDGWTEVPLLVRIVRTGRMRTSVPSPATTASK